jgi:alkylation response protein AidB-like acyl-CoA dehydrogenase
MEFELSDDQLALQGAARDLLDAYASPDRVRAHLAAGAPRDESVWAAMVEQGWLGVAVPEAEGGLGLGWVEAAVLLEEAGRHVAPVPLLGALVAIDALRGTEWAPSLLAGTRQGCVAWSPRPLAVDGGEVDGGTGSGAVSGAPGPVAGAATAAVAVVITPEDLWAVDLDSLGRPAVEPSMDGTQALSWLTLDRTPAVRVGGADQARRALDLAAVAASAELLGGAARVLEMSAQYAKDRVQFGQPIGSFQAVKHRCADMVVDVEGMRSVAWYGAWALAAGDADASAAASTAKTWCSDAAKRVMASGLQVHGGIGFTWEHDLHLFMKRSQLDQVAFGDAAYHRERLAGLLRARVAAGQSVI